MTSMLDTNICIAVMNGNTAARAKLSHISPDATRISSIVLAELYYGVQKSLHRGQNEQALADFLAICRVLDWPDEAAVTSGQIRANLESQGRIMGANDLLIAAHAMYLKAVLVTDNVRELQRIPSLALENWLA